MANTWQGEFPLHNRHEDGYERTSPVTAFPPNGYGLHDMIGNVWEWTSDWYSPKHEADAPKACCIPENPRGGREEGSYDPRQPNIKIPRKVIKGGSHLCAPNYCRRYRPAARHAEAIDTSTSHLGFRCVVRGRQMTSAPTSAFARALTWLAVALSVVLLVPRDHLVRLVDRSPSPVLERHFRAPPRADDVPLLSAAGDGRARGAA